ncbi:winged helix-turn-helix transcriptional regulator [Rhodoplanes sp. Z2-YC6860]|uniref:winged helix-turn-helix transcriptional regulator n=1 Tax=Rhodoplanes sp. Z2-YC6860 TaxID=674703 RepID=UPI00078B5FD3|nr:winged helix-turn-helix transcriptional regulator [Rhodoplanes sp. Z2-YC6860]AMN43464.1 MarR family transcriptional regulator [Rhodoplanes sp. Z2-YC6860]
MSSVDAELHDEKAQDQIVLGVLDAIDRDPSVTQRSLARELDIALGLTNAYLKRCILKGLIKVSQVPARRYAYYLTPQGFAEKSRLTASYLTHSLSFFRKARTQCGEMFAGAVARGQQRVVLVGEGDLADIASLVARDYAIKIVGVVPWTGNAQAAAAAMTALGPVDAAFITTVVQPQDAFDAVRSAIGAERVYAPGLLRLRKPGPVDATAEASR